MSETSTQRLDMPRDCPTGSRKLMKSNRAYYDQWFDCDENKGRWKQIKGTTPNIPCNSKSRYNKDPKYQCNPLTGRYTTIVPKGQRLKRTRVSGAPVAPITIYMRWLKDNRAAVK